MKRKITVFALSAALACGCMIPLAGCSQEEAEASSRMTVDINPSIELMLDDENKVVSVTALNDDGGVIIAGETIVGKSAENAVEIIVSVACETGYLVEGSVTADENTVSVSVSGNTEAAQALCDKAIAKAEAVLEEHGIEGKVEQIEALKLSELKKLAAECTEFSEEEIDAMTEDQLYKVIGAARIETALLLTEDLRQAYYAAKEYEISFAEREETAKLIEEMGGVYTALFNSYKTVVDLYSAAINSLDDLRYELLVSPDSAYQQSLVSLREAKADLLKQRNITASINVNDDLYAEATVALQLSEERYDQAVAAYEALGNTANGQMENLISALRGYEESLRTIEEAFPSDVKDRLSAGAKELENKLNETKDSFFASFEEAHADDIARITQNLIDQKQKLIDSVKAD
ncbi:MAG: hypothetical protein ACI4ST_05940 [Candidatus Gallimonas sp.]